MSFKLQNVGEICQQAVEELDRVRAKIRHGYSTAQFNRFKSMLKLPVEQIPCLVDPEEYEQEPFTFLYDGVCLQFVPAINVYAWVHVDWMASGSRMARCSMSEFDGCYQDDARLHFTADDDELQTLARNHQFVVDVNDPELTFIRYFERWVELNRIANHSRQRENYGCWVTAKEDWADEVRRLYQQRTNNNAN